MTWPAYFNPSSLPRSKNKHLLPFFSTITRILWNAPSPRPKATLPCSPFNSSPNYTVSTKIWRTATTLLAAQASEIVERDRDFVDSTQPYDLLWCTNADAAATQVAATQVRLKCNAAADLLRASENPLRDAVDAKRFEGIDVETGWSSWVN